MATRTLPNSDSRQFERVQREGRRKRERERERERDGNAPKGTRFEVNHFDNFLIQVLAEACKMGWHRDAETTRTVWDATRPLRSHVSDVTRAHCH